MSTKEKKAELDFPFYNDPKIKVFDIVILALAPILFTIYTFLPISIPWGLGPFVFTFTHLAAFLYVARGKISLLIRKPSFKEIVRVLVTLFLQYLFAIFIALFIKLVFGITSNANPILEIEMGVKFWLLVIVQLFGEELYKILLFLVALIIMNKLTKNRKLSIVVATIFSLISFGLLHMTTYGNIVQVILLQGVASIFCLYNYLKTKNILTSYLQHFLFDAIPFILAMLHFL